MTEKNEKVDLQNRCKAFLVKLFVKKKLNFFSKRNFPVHRATTWSIMFHGVSFFMKHSSALLDYDVLTDLENTRVSVPLINCVQEKSVVFLSEIGTETVNGKRKTIRYPFKKATRRKMRKRLRSNES